MNQPRARVVFEFSGVEIKKYGGVIVESWEHKKQMGRIRRAYLQEFNESERKQLGKLNTELRFYELGEKRGGYAFGGGYPDWIQMTLQKYHLLIRAANFFYEH